MIMMYFLETIYQTLYFVNPVLNEAALAFLFFLLVVHMRGSWFDEIICLFFLDTSNMHTFVVNKFDLGVTVYPH
jgi:hypothetical protein